MIRVAAVVLALTVLMSGCVGLGGSGGTDGTPQPTAPAAGSGGGSSSGGGSGSSSGGGGGGGSGAGFEPAGDFEEITTERQMADYIDRTPLAVYRPGEFYRYEGINAMTSEDGEPMPVAFEIQSGDGGEWLEADIVVTLDRDGEVSTFSQDDESIGRLLFAPEFSLTQNGRAWIWIYRFNVVTNVEPRISELSVGDSWRYDSGSGDEDTPSGFIFDVTERRSYAGQECLLVEIERFEGEETRLFSQSCVAPHIGMPLYYAQYQNDGTAVLEVELVEYRR